METFKDTESELNKKEEVYEDKEVVLLFEQTATREKRLHQAKSCKDTMRYGVAFITSIPCLRLTTSPRSARAGNASSLIDPLKTPHEVAEVHASRGISRS